jgi:hypothetical protein
MIGTSSLTGREQTDLINHGGRLRRLLHDQDESLGSSFQRLLLTEEFQLMAAFFYRILVIQQKRINAMI